MKVKKSHTITAKRLQYLFTEIAKLITSSLEVHKIIDAIMEQVQVFFQPRNWSLLRLDPITQELYFLVAKGIDENVVKHVRLKLGEGIAGHVAQSGKSMLVEDTKHHPYFTQKIDKLSGFDTHSLIAVPIKFQNQVLGVIEIINAFDDRAFTKRELSILETIADFSAIALTNAMTYERMSLLAIRDSLTGLYNRAHLNKLLQACSESSNAPETDKSYVVVALVDIDRFKQVNDQYGHRIGDEILCKVAERLQACCRNGGFAFRIGGDEFLIVIADLNQNEAPAVVEHLQNSLQTDSQHIPPAPGFSFGVMTGLKTDLKRLIDEADKQMYKNKGIKKEKEPGTIKGNALHE